MQLSFLGQTYEPATPAVETTPTHETVIFLGRPYTRKQHNMTQRQVSTPERIYRGVRY